MMLDPLVLLDVEGFGPLSSMDLRGPDHSGRDDAGWDSSVEDSQAPLPLVLRHALVAPRHEDPDFVYDPVRQVAVDRAGRPLAPQLGKDWTSIKGTDTDGDGGSDQDALGWEEV
jgi:putative ATP-grasp target RiPP